MTDERTRRALLGSLSAACVGFAGCSSDGTSTGTEPSQTAVPGSPTGERTPHPTSTPTDTAVGSTTDRRTDTETTKRATASEVPGQQTPDSAAADWQFDLGRAVDAPPGTGDGLVFVGTGGAPPQTPGGEAEVERQLFALDETDGTERWRYPTGHNVTTRPVVVGDHVVYVTGASGIAVTDDWGVTALSLDGEQQWRKGTTPAEILEATDSTVFVGVHEGQYGTDSYPATAISAIHVPTGRERWHERLGKFSVVTARDGRLCVGTNSRGRSNARAVALNARTGTVDWELSNVRLRAVTDTGLVGYRLSDGDSELLTVDFDGSEQWSHSAEVSDVFAADAETVYAAENGHVVARDAVDGTQQWRAETTFEFDSQAFVEQGRFFLSRGGTLVAFEEDGQTSWERDVAPVRVRDVKVIDRTVVVRSHRSGLVALDLQTGDEQWHLAAGSEIRGPTVADDRLFAATAEGSVYGISFD